LGEAQSKAFTELGIVASEKDIAQLKDVLAACGGKEGLQNALHDHLMEVYHEMIMHHAPGETFAEIAKKIAEKMTTDAKLNPLLQKVLTSELEEFGKNAQRNYWLAMIRRSAVNSGFAAGGSGLLRNLHPA
jgi:hypothetical protein